MLTKHRIFVVDDHPLIRKGLCEAINAEADLLVTGETGSCREALRRIGAERPDILVLDLNLKDGSGWSLLQDLRAGNTLPPTLVLSVNDEEVYAQRLIEAGARGYLMKDEPIASVLAAIRKILSGHLAISDNMVSRLLQPSSAPGPCPLEELSNRELQVYEMLRQGLSNKEIAAHLGISHKTIGTYKARLMEKLGVRTTHDLIEYA
ncbi:MAG: response regulator transcription factor [Spartobacteria bacterium]|nr:response regulator transcription factor [Spartobacteria bacterium]